MSSSLIAQVDAAEALTGSSGGQKREGVEPRLASLEIDENVDCGGGDGGNETGLSVHPHQHPSSTVARDSRARVPGLGRDAAASLVQSRFRGYRARRNGGAGGGITGGGIAGGRDRVDGPIAGETAINGEGGKRERQAGSGGGRGGSSEKCSILDLEVGSSSF